MESLPAFYKEFEHEIPKSVKFHLTIIKWIGVFLVLSVCALPGIIIIVTSSGHNLPPYYDHTREVMPDTNQSACVFVKQFHLLYRTYATVCNIDGYVFLDLRQFVNGSQTIIGIALESNQWTRLKQLIPSIDEGFLEARNLTRG